MSFGKIYYEEVNNTFSNFPLFFYIYIFFFSWEEGS